MLSPAGRIARARCLAQFAQIKDTALLRSQQPYVHAALGEIALTEKRYSDAIREFQRADTAMDGHPVNEDPLTLHFNLGRAYDLAEQTGFGHRRARDISAHSRSTAVSTTTGSVLPARTSGWVSCTTLKGDREKAISHLSKFVELWKNADPELQPTVADAKRRLAKLQAGGKS